MPWWCFPFGSKSSDIEAVGPLTSSDPELRVQNQPTRSQVFRTLTKLPESLHKVLEMSPYSMCAADMLAPDQPLVFVNDRFLMHTGYSRSEVLGVNCRFLQGMDTDRATVQHLRSCIDSGKEFLGRLVNYAKDGEPMWNYIMLQPLHDNKGTLTHYTALQIFVGIDDDKQKAVVAKELAMVASYVENKGGRKMSASAGPEIQPRAPTRESFDNFHRNGEKRAEILKKELRDSLNSMLKRTKPKSLMFVIGSEDPGLPVLFCSQHLFEETWLSEDEVLGANLTFLFGQPKTSDEIKAFADLTTTIHAKHTITQRRWIRTRHDAILMLWGELSVFPVSAPDGSCPFYVGSFSPGPSPHSPKADAGQQEIDIEMVGLLEDWLKNNQVQNMSVRPSLDFGAGPSEPPVKQKRMSNFSNIEEGDEDARSRGPSTYSTVSQHQADESLKKSMESSLLAPAPADTNFKKSMESSLLAPAPAGTMKKSMEGSLMAPAISLPSPISPKSPLGASPSGFNGKPASAIPPNVRMEMEPESPTLGVGGRKGSVGSVNEYEMNMELESSDDEDEGTQAKEQPPEEDFGMLAKRAGSVGLQNNRSRRQAAFVTLLPEKTMWIDMVHQAMAHPDAPRWGMSEDALEAIKRTLNDSALGDDQVNQV